MPTILVVEDETKVARFLKRGLEGEGFEVTTAADGIAGESIALEKPFDVIILDILLPRKSGTEVLTGLRAHGLDTPVLMLTARGSKEDIVSGLNLGADDYLTKPFSFEELIARIRSLLRRSASKTELHVADLTLDTVTHRASRNGATIELTAREYSLLEHLMRNAGSLVTRSQIATKVWGYTFDPGTNIVDVYVNHLRKKIDDGHAPRLLHTERGQGYVLEDRTKPR